MYGQQRTLTASAGGLYCSYEKELKRARHPQVYGDTHPSSAMAMHNMVRLLAA
jgi:hypothetical protein